MCVIEDFKDQIFNRLPVHFKILAEALLSNYLETSRSGMQNCVQIYLNYLSKLSFNTVVII